MNKKVLKKFFTIFVLMIVPVWSVFMIYNSYMDVVSSRANLDNKMSVVKKWRDGEQKTLAVDWVDDNIGWSQYCYFDPSGKNHGCAIYKEGKPWSGRVVEWYWYSKEDDPEEAYGIPRVSMNYKDGKPDGSWNAYYQNGVINSEIIWKEGRRVKSILYAPSGKVIKEIKL